MTNLDPKDPQAELRHSIHMKMLEKSESAKDAGELTVVPLGFAVNIALALIQAKEQQLLSELLGESKEYEKWAGGNQATGRAITVKAVPVSVIEKYREGL